MVDDDADLGALGHFPEELIDALFRGEVVVGRQDQSVLGAASGGVVGELDGGLGGRHAGTGDNGDPAVHDLAAPADELFTLFQTHHVVLTGSAAHQDTVHAAVNNIIDDLLVALKVDALIGMEGGHQGGIQPMDHILITHIVLLPHFLSSSPAYTSGILRSR